jgi:hypothetical protein
MHSHHLELDLSTFPAHNGAQTETGALQAAANAGSHVPDDEPPAPEFGGFPGRVHVLVQSAFSAAHSRTQADFAWPVSPPHSAPQSLLQAARQF